MPDPGTLAGERPLRVGPAHQPDAARPSAAAVHEGLADGTVDLLVGTHALLTDRVVFRSLGVVVIDEQHRFGVEQRAALRDKGRGDGRHRRRSRPAGDDGDAHPPDGGHGRLRRPRHDRDRRAPARPAAR